MVQSDKGTEFLNSTFQSMFGFKIWVMAGKDGYRYHLQIYTGREQNERALPLGTRVVQHMIAAVDAHTTTQRHHLFFDNFFTSYQLLKELADNGISGNWNIWRVSNK